MNINIEPEKLLTFAAYVSMFSKKINTECNEITAAASRLGQLADAEDVAEIQKLTQYITQILDRADPDLDALETKIEAYANTITRLKAISKD